ncbi:superoxide dismutase family protein [Salegentibacter sp. HM20]
MKRISLSLILCAGLVFTGCKNEKKEEEKSMEEKDRTEMKGDRKSSEEVKKITVSLEPKGGSEVEGEVVFREENGTVTMTAIISGLAEGEHAIHLHEKADCSADDGSSAGGHWNPTGQPHGKWGASEGYHKGDIGNFTVDANGRGSVNFSTDEWCIGCGDKNKDITGTSVIIHDGVDDFTSQPSGNAGNRVACAEIKK